MKRIPLKVFFILLPFLLFQGIAQSADVPLMQGQNIVRLFFGLLNEKRIPEAVSMLDSSVTANDSAKKAWGSQFNIFSSICLQSIAPSSLENVARDQQTYKVVLEVTLKPNLKKTVIPTFGWENGQNIRWVSLVKDSTGKWKILTISTGP